MGSSVLDLQEIDRTQVSLVGGKGARTLGNFPGPKVSTFRPGSA